VIAANVGIDTWRHGERARCLQRLIGLGLPVPHALALSFDAVRDIAAGRLPDTREMLAEFGDGTLVSVRPSSGNPDWGGPGAILNIGMNDARHTELRRIVGEEGADTLYVRFIQAYAIHVARLDSDMF